MPTIFQPGAAQQLLPFAIGTLLSTAAARKWEIFWGRGHVTVDVGGCPLLLGVTHQLQHLHDRHRSHVDFQQVPNNPEADPSVKDHEWHLIVSFGLCSLLCIILLHIIFSFIKRKEKEKHTKISERRADSCTKPLSIFYVSSIIQLKTETNKMVPGPVTKTVSWTVPEQNGLPEFLPQEVSTAPMPGSSVTRVC